MVDERVYGIANEYGLSVEGVQREEREETADKIHVHLCDGSIVSVCDSPLLKIEFEAEIRNLE